MCYKIRGAPPDKQALYICFLLTPLGFGYVCVCAPGLLKTSNQPNCTNKSIPGSSIGDRGDKVEKQEKGEAAWPKPPET